MEQATESNEHAHLEAWSEDSNMYISPSAFFQEQDDVVSEILSFLDAPSLLNMCNTTKKAASLLRYQHVFGAARRRRNSHSMTRIDEKKNSHKNSCIILDKLAKVYSLNESSTETTSTAVVTTANLKWTKRANAITTTTWTKRSRPSPLRLLQLANGKKCERCHRDLSPCVFAGRSGLGKGVLPSLSFGEFCCTLCIFDRSN